MINLYHNLNCYFNHNINNHKIIKENKRLNTCWTSKRYYQKKKTQQTQTQMEIEKPIEERKRSHPEKETSSNCIEPKWKQTQDNRLNNIQNQTENDSKEIKILTQSTKHEKMNDDAIGIDVILWFRESKHR